MKYVVVFGTIPNIGLQNVGAGENTREVMSKERSQYCLLNIIKKILSKPKTSINSYNFIKLKFYSNSFFVIKSIAYLISDISLLFSKEGQKVQFLDLVEIFERYST